LPGWIASGIHSNRDRSGTGHSAQILKVQKACRADSIAEPCRREGIAQSLYCTWSKELMEAGKRRLAGDTARAATTDEVKDLRREARDLKECAAEYM
jgi:transposase-like protein